MAKYKHTRSVVLKFDIINEIDSYIAEKRARKYATNINHQLIDKSRSKGKIVKPLKMKNNLVSYAIQSPLEKMFEKNYISHSLFAAGQRYSHDYLLSSKDNMSKQQYDGTGISTISNKTVNKEPFQAQIDAYKRLEKIKKALDYRNKKFRKLIEYFLEKEICVSLIEKRLNMGRRTVGRNIGESLEIIKECYEKNKTC